jgi:hypothetical protein
VVSNADDDGHISYTDYIDDVGDDDDVDDDGNDDDANGYGDVYDISGSGIYNDNDDDCAYVVPTYRDRI